jgi:predicted transcriptional regulator
MAMKLRKDILLMHKEADIKLSEAADKYIKSGIKLACEEVAKKVGCSDITIRNYVYGKGRDGFLKIIITKEFKKLKI